MRASSILTAGAVLTGIVVSGGAWLREAGPETAAEPPLILAPEGPAKFRVAPTGDAELDTEFMSVLNRGTVRKR